MKYLLIDFGATYIKCALYYNGSVIPTRNYPSPFTIITQISKLELNDLLSNIVKDHDTVDGIVICTILGGKWDNGIYKSWKCLEPGDKGSTCMIGGLLNSTIIHTDHAEFTTASYYTDKLELAGHINNTPTYCALGDTNCVIRSLNIPDDGVAINMGTGSQVISNTNIKRFFPAGRSFLVFDRLFELSNKSLFDIMQDVTLEDIKQSSLDVNLAVFEQACTWTGGGAISGITESNFSLKNIAASVMKSFVNQYQNAVGEVNTIILVGGISNKISILAEVFRHYYPGKTIIHEKDTVEATHRGLACMINEHLKQ